MYHSQPQQYVPRRIADPRVARLRLELHALVESAAVGLRQLLSKSPHTQPSQNMPTSCYRHVLRCCCIPYIVSGCSVRYCSVKNAEWGFTRAERRTKEDLGAPHTVLSERGQRRTKEAPREDRVREQTKQVLPGGRFRVRIDGDPAFEEEYTASDECIEWQRPRDERNRDRLR